MGRDYDVKFWRDLLFGSSHDFYRRGQSLMSMPTVETEYLYSSLADDPDLGEIVDLFVDEMPGRVAKLVACLSTGDWEQLGRYAHQMKGACGSYGFHQLTPTASRLEQAARHDPEEATIREAVEELAALCQKVRSGVGCQR